ncbi:hypothetical protein EHQ76_05235 [Leptospira barantonii]|uniref:SbsA Ig-like domain-containing protein n=1 Tax=Leptospira barantonii TaxID=2023184 RepID=A0A5F2BNK1_9LEPT|nr:Ig-like domain-containing protein [Leptospira barantonii]TGM07126.1 hypothetical protein EHQ76_05235 [Leptospira barantonii]
MSNVTKIVIVILTVIFNSNCVNGSKNSLPFLAYLDLSSKSKDSSFTIAQITPGSGVSNIPLNTSVQVTFSSDFDSSTLNSSSFFLEKNGIRIQANLNSNGSSAVLTPSSNLSASSTYRVTVKQEIQSVSGISLKEDLSWEFTTAGIVDAIAPALSLRTPPIGASAVSNSTSIQLAFTEAVDCTTVDSSTFVLKNENTQVDEPSSVNCLGLNATLTPDNVLLPNTMYRVNVSASITDLASNSLPAQTWTFMTGAGPDSTPPVVSFSSPNPFANDVSVNTAISVAFSEEIHCGSISGNFTLDDNVLIPGDVNVTVSNCSGTTASITPTSPLSFNTTYTASVTSGVTDLNSNPLTINSNATWTFTTGNALDSTPPTVTSAVPTDNSNGIGTNVSPMAVFSEVMACGTVNATSFKVRRQSAPLGFYLTGSVNCFGTSAVWTPDPMSPFIYNTTYTVEINAGATDGSNNPVVPTSWNFTTGPGPDVTSPNFSFSTPANGSLKVPVNTAINIAFDENLNCGSVLGLGNITLDDDPGTPATTVALNVTCNGNTVTVAPTAPPLAFNTNYTVKLTNGITDLFGNPLTINANTTWSFTTGSAPDVIAPYVTFQSPVSGSTGVATNANITVAFSETVDCFTLNFTVNNGISGSVNCSGATATFVPNALTPLNAGTSYQATIVSVKDIAGNAIGGPVNWTFTTGLAPDITPPTGMIQNLKNNSIVTSGFVIGTAIDDRSVSLVEVSLDGAPYANATGTSNWKFQLPAGTATWKQNSQHTIQVKTTDSSNNVSFSAITTVRKGTNQDINGDGYADLVSSEYGQGLVYVFHSSGTAGITTTNAQFASKILIGSSGDQFGRAVALGDINGDGYADVIVGAPLWNGSIGRVYVFHSAGSSGISITFSAFANSQISGTVASGEFGTALVAGDLNGDGYSDLVASAPLGALNNGTVYVFVSPGATGITAATVAGATANRTGVAATDGFGVSLALGNVNGDNFADIAVGSPVYNGGKGRIYVYYGAAAGGLNAAAPNTLTNNSNLGSGMGMLGKTVAMGDLNGDGYSDIIAGAPQLDVNGVAGTYYGTVRLWTSSGPGGVATDTIGNVAYINGVTNLDLFGQTLTVQDLDLDGRADIIVGADQNSVPSIYVYMTATAPAVAIPGMRTKLINATTNISGLGGLGMTVVGNKNFCTPLGAGDPNGDGYTDLYIGGNGTTGVYIFNSSAVGLNVLVASAANIANPNLDATYGVSVR